MSTSKHKETDLEYDQRNLIAAAWGLMRYASDEPSYASMEGVRDSIVAVLSWVERTEKDLSQRKGSDQ